MPVLASIIYLLVVFHDNVAFCLSLIPEPMPLGLLVTGGTCFLCVSNPPSPRFFRPVALVYVVPSHNEGSASGTAGILPSSLCLSEQVTILWEGG